MHIKLEDREVVIISSILRKTFCYWWYHCCKRLDKQTQSLLEFFIPGRQHKHSLWLLTQSYSTIPKNLRRQAKEWYPKEKAEVNLAPCGFLKIISSRERLNPWSFVTFIIIVSHIFPQNFVKTAQVVQKIWRFSTLILTIFINFLDCLTFLLQRNQWHQHIPNDVSIFLLWTYSK